MPVFDTDDAKFLFTSICHTNPDFLELTIAPEALPSLQDCRKECEEHTDPDIPHGLSALCGSYYDDNEHECPEFSLNDISNVEQ